MLFKFEKLISYISNYFTLLKGDLIFTGTPQGVGKARIDDMFEGAKSEEAKTRASTIAKVFQFKLESLGQSKHS